MKATTAIVALAVMGLLLQLNGYSTLGGEVLDRVSPLQVNYASTITIGAIGLLSFGVIMLGSSIPTKILATLLLGVLTMPVGILKDAQLAIPSEIQVVMGIIWTGLMIQAVVGALRGDV